MDDGALEEGGGCGDFSRSISVCVMVFVLRAMHGEYFA